MKKCLSLLLALLLILPILTSCKNEISNDPGHLDDQDQADTPNTPGESVSGIVRGEGAVLGETKYYDKDVVVANIIVTDEPYNADPTGQTDSTAAIQQALYDIDRVGGGVVYIPAGDYLVTRTIFVPSGCVLQGDWQDPDEVGAGEAQYGTVIIAQPTPLSSAQLDKRASNPLIMMEGYCGVVGLTFYYPKQSVSSPVPYGYTIYSEAPRTAVLRDITMINSYRGVGVGTGLTMPHELFQNESLHICALETGVEMYRSTEVGFTVDLTVSPEYWINAGRGWACKDADILRNYCRENTMGLIVQKLDDECLSTLRFEYCRTAIYAPKVVADQQDIWGTIYDVKISNSIYGIVIEGLCSSIGLVIANAEIEASEKAIVNSSAKGTLKLAGIKLLGEGAVHAEGGDIMYDKTTDLSQYKITYGKYKKPAANLYIPDLKELNGKKVDAASAIQLMLDEAGKTGGVVYLPVGVYSLYTPIHVPEGVQLRGPVPVFTRDATNQHPDGCVLLTYVTNEATIYLEADAGVNGLRVFCPVYDAQTALEAIEAQEDEVDTCVAIKGLGAGVYTYNVGITATMVGVDFSDCDNHLVKQTFGCTYNTFARVGGKNGVVTCCLNNPHFVNRQSFASLGYLDEEACDIERQKQYSNGQNEGTAAVSGFATLRDKLLRKYCTMVEVVNADNQIISDIFMYAPYQLVSVSDSTARIYNTSSDFVGFGAAYHVENGSNVVAVNSLRSAGESVHCDEDSLFSLYNRLNTEIYYEGDFHSSANHVDSFDFEVSEKMVLGVEDHTKGIRQVTLNADETFIKDGEYSYMHAPKRTSTTEIIMEYSFAQTDISDYMYDDGYLHMWIYVEDMSTQTWGGAIELTSSGQADNAEIYWVITSFLTHNGWNELWLPLGDAKMQGATKFNEYKVNYLRIFNTNNHERNQGAFYIDDIYFCIAESDKIRQPIKQSAIINETKPRPSNKVVIPDQPIETEKVIQKTVISTCDVLEYIGHTVPLELNIDPSYIKEGSGSWKSSASKRNNGEEILYLRADKGATLADISQYMNNGYLHFWLYIDGDYEFTSGQFELTSSAKNDVDEMNWNPIKYSELKKGWNEINLPLSEASVSNTFDPTNLNYMRLYIRTADKTYGTYYIDDIYFYVEKQVINDDEVPDVLVLDNCDEVGVVTQSFSPRPCYTPEYVKEGTGSYFSEASNRKNGNEIFLMRGEWNLAPYMENGYLHLWVYFTDAETFKMVQLELTSSGKPDVQEMSFYTAHFKGLKQGWNEIVLPFADASAVAADFNPENINFIRMYTVNEDGNWGDYYIDDIYVSNN